MDWVASEHCLYCIYGSMTKDQVLEHFSETVSEIESIICERTNRYVPNCKYKVNVLPGKPTVVYIWATNREIPWMLTGRTHEGSNISDVKKTPSGNNQACLDGMSAKEQLFAMDWDEIPTAQYEKYIPPNMPGCKEPPIFAQAYADVPGPEYDIGTLFCKSPLPSDYTEDNLCKLFAPFNTSRSALHVTKTGKGNAYIRFPVPTDACFALMLMKKHYDEGRKISLSFDHSIAKEPAKRGNRHYRK